MASPTLYMLAGAAALAILQMVYRRVFDATAAHVDALAKENRALRSENEQLKVALAHNGIPLASEPVQHTVEDRIATLVRSGNKIAAIRDYRASTGVGLAEAKAHVEALERAMK